MPGLVAKDPRAQWAGPGVVALCLHALLLGYAIHTPVDRTVSPTTTIDVSLEALLESPRDRLAETEPPGAADTLPQKKAVTSTPRAISAARAPSASVKARENFSPTQPNVTPIDQPQEAGSPNVRENAELPASHIAGGVAEPSPSQSGVLAGGGNGNSLAFGDTGSRPAREFRGSQPLLASKPRLLSNGTACQGLFAEAADYVDKVTMVLSVDTQGKALPIDVRSSVTAPHATLHRAALVCAQRLRFEPARRADGSVVAASSIVSLTLSKRTGLPPSTRRGTI